MVVAVLLLCGFLAPDRPRPTLSLTAAESARRPPVGRLPASATYLPVQHAAAKRQQNRLMLVLTQRVTTAVWLAGRDGRPAKQVDLWSVLLILRQIAPYLLMFSPRLFFMGRFDLLQFATSSHGLPERSACVTEYIDPRSALRPAATPARRAVSAAPCPPEVSCATSRFLFVPDVVKPRFLTRFGSTARGNPRRRPGASTRGCRGREGEGLHGPKPCPLEVCRVAPLRPPSFAGIADY